MKSVGLILALALMGTLGPLVANGQYFSTSDGATLSRIGKRNYLYNLIYSRRPPSAHASLPSSNSLIDSEQEASSLLPSGARDTHYQPDKLSTMRKLHYKYGKRGYVPDYSDEIEIEDDSNEDYPTGRRRYQKLIEQFMNEYARNNNDRLL
jgi:hypothetical protein